MSVIILANGLQRRLPTLTTHKSLLWVGDEPILARTIRLVRETHSDEPITIVGPTDLADAALRVHGGAAGVLHVGPTRCVLDTLYETRFRWGDFRTTVLLADVIYSRQTMQSILNDGRGIGFAATASLGAGHGEVFAMWFNLGRAYDLEKELGLIECRQASHDGVHSGHMRKLLWAIQKLDGLDSCRAGYSYDLVLPISDWTDDIDEPADIERLPELAAFAAKENP